MKRIAIFLWAFACFSVLSAQSRYRTSNGRININASTPLEDIDATNTRVSAILAENTGDFAVVLLIRDFQFRRKLMQEHFNENFMQSDRYPKAYFRGELSGFSMTTLSTAPQQLTLEGTLTIHGVARNLKATIEGHREDQLLHLTTTFIVAPKNHDIKIPKILFRKIAEEVRVRVELTLTPESGKLAE